MKGLLDFAKLGNSKKIVLVVNILDLIILVFMDYLLLENMGINVRTLFLNSFHEFVLNIFTMEFFTAIIGLFVLLVMYNLIFELLFPIFFYRIMLIIYGLVVIIFGWLPFQLYHIFKTRTRVIIDDSVISQLNKYKFIKVDNSGNIFPEKRTSLLLEIYKDVNGDGKIEDFYIKATKTISSISIIAICLHCTSYMILIFTIISIIPLAIASAFFFFYLNKNELIEIVNKITPNLTLEQLDILKVKDESNPAK